MRNKKVLWIIVSIIIVLGILLAVVGITTGTNRGVYFDNTGVHIIGKEEKEEFFTMEELKEISINVQDFNILFEESEEYGIGIKSYEDSNEIEKNVEDRILKIKEKEKARFRIFSFDFSFLEEDKTPYIKIYLPKEALLNCLEINTKNSNLKVSNLEVKELKIGNKYGKVELEEMIINNMKVEMQDGNFFANNVKAAQIDFSSKYGEANFNTINSEVLNAQLKNGNLKLNKVYVREAVLNCKYGQIQGSEIEAINSKITNENGDIKLEGDFIGNTEIDSTYGKIRVDLKKEEIYYNVDLNTKYGNITLNGEKLEENTYQINHEKEKLLKAKAKNGNIMIDFNK